MPDPIHYAFIEVSSDVYTDELDLRTRLLRHPLGLQLTTNDTKDDHQQIHIGAFVQAQLIACVIAAPVDGNTFQVRQMAVEDHMQGRGVGRGLMLKAEQAIHDHQGQRIILDARVSAQGFYQSLGYHAQGNAFIHNTIPHILMEKQFT